MFSRKVAKVLETATLSPDCEELIVQLDGEKSKAINYTLLTGPVSPGDTVVLNTTAVELMLGSGGYHFVYLNLNRVEQSSTGAGHIMKLRYTPMQLPVLAVEEEQSAHHQVMSKAENLHNMPVVVAELHSMLAPVVLTLKKIKPAARIVYLMTDGGTLPAYFSISARKLRQAGLLDSVITCGHAFGGDLEAVNIYSGLLAAKYVALADVAVVCMGPGIVGTGTPFGFSGIETGENVNRVHTLGGRAVVVPRISFNDSRSRHHGFSHHSLTALGKVALAAADLPLPSLGEERNAVLTKQLQAAGLNKKHRVIWIPEAPLGHLGDYGVVCSTMGRTPADDQPFFMAATAAAIHTASLMH
ncbi:MAG: DUF3866 family protein [Clostridiales bacterium]|nr:DUF3866 family protein [Clostridiales bacterium]